MAKPTNAKRKRKSSRIMPVEVRHKPNNLDRFIEAQESVYTDVLSELKSGRKRTHWIWFIFPQYQGLDWIVSTNKS